MSGNGKGDSDVSTTALTTRSSGMALVTFEDHKRFAMAAFCAGILGDANREVAIGKALVSMQYGAELGVGPMSALSSINVIKGKPAMGAALMGSLIQSSGTHRYRISELTDERCTVRFWERMDGQWEELAPSVFSQADAKQAGLTGGKNDMYRKFPRNLLFARALSNGARWHCPSIFHGAIYTPEELGSDVIEEDFRPVDHRIDPPEPTLEQDDPPEPDPSFLEPGQKLKPDDPPEPEPDPSTGSTPEPEPERPARAVFAEYEGGPSRKQYQRLCEYRDLDAVPIKWKQRIDQLIEDCKSGKARKGAIGKALAAVKTLLASRANPETIQGAKESKAEFDREAAHWSRLASFLQDDRISKPTKGMIKHLYKRYQANDSPSETDRLEAIAMGTADLARETGQDAAVTSELASIDAESCDRLRELRGNPRADQSMIGTIDALLAIADRGQLPQGEAPKLVAEIENYLERAETTES